MTVETIGVVQPHTSCHQRPLAARRRHEGGAEQPPPPAHPQEAAPCFKPRAAGLLGEPVQREAQGCVWAAGPDLYQQCQAQWPASGVRVQARPQATVPTKELTPLQCAGLVGGPLTPSAACAQRTSGFACLGGPPVTFSVSYTQFTAIEVRACCVRTYCVRTYCVQHSATCCGACQSQPHSGGCITTELKGLTGSALGWQSWGHRRGRSRPRGAAARTSPAFLIPGPGHRRWKAARRGSRGREGTSRSHRRCCTPPAFRAEQVVLGVGEPSPPGTPGSLPPRPFPGPVEVHAVTTFEVMLWHFSSTIR